jgi:hypothetical protein
MLGISQMMIFTNLCRVVGIHTAIGDTTEGLGGVPRLGFVESVSSTVP